MVFSKTKHSGSKHVVVKIINSIEEIYDIIKPFKLTKDKKNFVDKYEYIKNYNLEKLDKRKIKKLEKVLFRVIVEEMEDDKSINISDLSKPITKILLDYAQYLFRCVYFKLDSTGNHVLAHYTSETTYNKVWNKFTRSSRGIVVDLNEKKIIAHPYDKFYNYGEMPETRDGELPDLPYEDAEKLDGSEGILYKTYNGDIKIITKGTFNSEQGEFATKILYDKYPDLVIGEKRKYLLEMIENLTFVFEILYASDDMNRIVVNYGSEPDLKLIGVRDLRTGEMLSYEWVQSWAKLLGVPSTSIETMTLEKMLEEKKKRSNFEGWVRRYSNGLYMKIKCDEYLEQHGARFGTSEKAVWHIIKNGKWDDFISNVPKEFTLISQSFYDKLMDFSRSKDQYHINLYKSLPEIKDQKEFALIVKEKIKDKNALGFIFALRNGKDISYIRDILAWKNFRDEMNKHYGNN